MSKVLVIEDERNIIELIRVHLEKKGFQVIFSERGIEGKKKVLSESPQLVILNIGLPDIEGCVICGEIKSDPRTRDIPVIVCSAFCQKRYIDKSEEAGADYFCAKPFNPAELADKVEDMIKEARLAKV